MSIPAKEMPPRAVKAPLPVDPIDECVRLGRESASLRDALRSIVRTWDTHAEACADNSAVASTMAQIARSAIGDIDEDDRMRDIAAQSDDGYRNGMETAGF